MPIAITICLRSFTGIFEKLVIGIRSGTFSQTSYITRAGSTPFAGLSICILLMFMNPMQEITTITGDSISAGSGNCLATQIVSCLYAPMLHDLCYNMIDILKKSLSLPKIGIGAECICSIFLCMVKTPLKPRLMYVVPSKMSSPKFSTRPKHERTCRVPIFLMIGMIPYTLIDYFFAVRSLGASRWLVKLFQCGLGEASLILFGSALVSTNRVE